MLDQADHDIGPFRRILNPEIIAVDVEKLHHRHKAGALVSLGERVGVRDTRQQPNGKRDDVLFSVGKRILRACHGAFQESLISQKVRLPGKRYYGMIDLDDCL